MNKHLERLELEYLENINSDVDQRKQRLPLTDPKEIKALIWNLLKSDSWAKKISFNDYSEIMDVLIERLTL